MEVFSKISTLQQQQFVYMIDCVWSFLIACVFNLQIRHGRRLQFTSVRGQSDRVCTSANELLKKGGGQQGQKNRKKIQGLHKNAHNVISYHCDF